MTAIVVSACGGGGGGGSGSSSTPTPTPSAPVTASVDALQGLTISPLSLGSGISVPFSGPLDPAKTTVDVTVNGTHITGTTSFSSGNSVVTFTPTVRLPFGKSVTVVITSVDTFGRVVQTTVTFNTSAMVCADIARWSNPAVFSTALQNCVAHEGVQWLVDRSFNKSQDNSCTMSIGVVLSPACRAYMENGTMGLSDTSMVVNGHAVTWEAHIGTDGKSSITLLDTNDPTKPVPLATKVLSSDLLWTIGNPSGESISVTTAVNGVNKTELVTWDASSSSLVVTCLLNCT